MPKVSIIVPCYGVEKYLDRCMESLIAQTLKDIEIILVDDGSLDRVPEMCDEWASRDSRIKVVHKQNGGLGYARNSGLSVATGEYVAFIDSDDYVDKDMYRRLYEDAVTENADAVFCGYNLERSTGQWDKSAEVRHKTVWKGEDVRTFMLDMVASAPYVAAERLYYMSVWHAVYRRDIIEKNHIRFESERVVASEDIPFQVDFLRKSNIVTYLPFNGYYYCLNGASLTATFKPEKFGCFKTLHRVLSEKFNGQPDGQNRVDRLFIGYCRSHLRNMSCSGYTDQRTHVRQILGDEIWREIKTRYKLSYFKRPDHKLVYWLISKRYTWLILLYLRLLKGAVR